MSETKKVIPATQLRAITPNDGADLGHPCRSIYVGTGGDIVVVAVDDSVSVTFTAVPQGTVLPVYAARVKSTGTTASNLIAMF